MFTSNLFSTWPHILKTSVEFLIVAGMQALEKFLLGYSSLDAAARAALSPGAGPHRVSRKLRKDYNEWYKKVRGWTFTESAFTPYELPEDDY